MYHAISGYINHICVLDTKIYFCNKRIFRKIALNTFYCAHVNNET